MELEWMQSFMYKRSFFFSTIELIFTMFHDIWYVGTFCQMKIPETFDSLKERQWCWYFRFYLSCTSKRMWCIENNVQQNYRFYFSLDDIIDQFWFLKKCLNHSLVSIRCFSMSTIICKYWKDTFTLESPPSFHQF